MGSVLIQTTSTPGEVSLDCPKPGKCLITSMRPLSSLQVPWIDFITPGCLMGSQTRSGAVTHTSPFAFLGLHPNSASSSHPLLLLRLNTVSLTSDNPGLCLKPQPTGDHLPLPPHHHSPTTSQLWSFASTTSQNSLLLIRV